MDPLWIGAAGFGVVFVLLFTGQPVAVALGVTGLGGLWLLEDAGFAFAVAKTLPYNALADYAWAVLPMFVLMGALAETGGLTTQLFRAAQAWLSWMRGGLLLAVIAGSAAFSAVSGSTMVNAAVFTRLALPEAVAQGYSRVWTIGAIATAGTLAAMIPPSLTMVLYSLITEQSVGALLLAGVLPGLLNVTLYMIMALGLAWFAPGAAPPRRRFAEADLMSMARALWRVWPMAALMGLVLGGLFGGLFTPSAAGAMGAGGALLLTLTQRKAGGRALARSFREAASLAGSLLAVIVGGLLFSRFLVVTGGAEAFTDAAVSVIATPAGLLLVISVAYLVLGCVMDTASLTIVTLPIFFAMAERFGVDPIWFGVIFVKLIEIAVLTPPVGLNLFAAYSAAGGAVNFRDVVVGALPFLAMDILCLACLVAFPPLATWLPGML